MSEWIEWNGVAQSIKAILDGHPRWHDIACYATLVENDISEGGK